MISINDTTPSPAKPEAYRLRTEAENAAVAAIGPHARRGFEYETFKCDGKWLWKATDEVKPATTAELKANGGKRSLIALATKITQQEATPMAAPQHELDSMKKTEGQQPDPFGGHGDEAAVDAGLPPFLKRGDPACTVPVPTPDEHEKAMAKLRKEADPATRKIKNPPDAGKVARKVEREKAKLAKVPGTPEFVKAKAKAKAETAAGKPAQAKKAAKGAKVAPKAKKAASGAPKKMVAVSGKYETRGALIKAGIAAGHDDDKILKNLVKAFPDCTYKANDVRFYRRRMGQA